MKAYNLQSLIKALQIFLKYDNPNWPTHCEHDVLYVDVDPAKVSKKDKSELDKLGFFAGTEDDEYDGGFFSYVYGSC